MQNGDYLPQLQAEKDNIDSSFVHASRLLAEEIERVQSGGNKRTEKLVELHHEKPQKLAIKVKIPAQEFPKMNFVGKLLGPKGQSFKQLQEETGTKMTILGKGSMREKSKEEELRKEGGKYAHLNEELHVLVNGFGQPEDLYGRFAVAAAELKKILTPDPEDFQQFEDLRFLNGDEMGGGRGRGRGRGRGGPPMMGRGGRGGPQPGPLLATPPLGGDLRRPGPPTRGMVGRGGPPPRGSRGGLRGGPAGRGAARPEPLMERGYDYEEGYSRGGAGYEDPYAAGYEEEAYPDPYAAHGRGDSDTQYFDYSHGSSAGRAEQAYDDYGDGYGQQSGYGKAPARPKGDFRSHPYGAGRGGPRY